MTAFNKYQVVFRTIPDFCNFYKFDYEKTNTNSLYFIKKNNVVVAEIVNPLNFGPYARLNDGKIAVPFFHDDGRKANIYHAERRLHIFFEMLADNVEPIDIENIIRIDILLNNK